jgi:chromosome segregation ATPase
METPQNFRTAMRGFKREDVVQYIEYMNARFASERKELETEISILRAKVDNLSALPEEANQQIDKLNAWIAELEAAAAAPELAQLEERCQQLERERDEALAALEQAKREAVTVQAGDELEAYRRAERTERLAQERAELVYHRVNGVLADATVKVEAASAQIGEISESVLGRLSQLQEAIVNSKQALEQASATMYSLRPTDKE